MAAEKPIDWTAVLAALELQKLETMHAIAAVRRLMGEVGKAPGLGALASTLAADHSQSRLRDDMFFGMSAPEAIREYLTYTKKPQSVVEITQALMDHGFTTRSEHPPDFIRATLRRLNDVVQVKKDWALASWYRGAKLGKGKDDAPDAKVPKKRGRPKKSPMTIIDALAK